MAITPAQLRTDAGIKCGAGYIARGLKCRAGAGSPEGGDHSRRNRALAIGLGVAGAAGLAAGAYALGRRGAGGPDLSITPVRVGVGGPQRGYQARLPEGKPRGILAGTATPTPPALPGLSPRALLKGAAPRVSKTQRLRLNARAAARIAEQRIAQTAREEVRRIAQIGVTMAETGEAAGMASKNAFRGIRLRVEAARRKWEPGYRKGKTVKPPQSLLPGASQSPVSFSQPPKIITPEGVRIARDPASRRRIRRQP